LDIIVETRGLTRAFETYRLRGETSVSLDAADNPGGVLLYLFQRAFRSERVVVYALRGVDTVVERGCVTCLLGPNGSGKSTYLRVVAGLLTPTEGVVLIDGRDAEEVERWRYINYIMGPTLGGVWLSSRLTVREALETYCKVFDLPRERIDHVLEVTGLRGIEGERIYTLSTGTVARLVLAQGLLKEAPVYLMDEVFVGISLDERVRLYDYIRRLTRAGATFIVATNDIWEAQKLCDYIYLLDGGRVAASGSVEELLLRYTRRVTVRLTLRGGREAVRAAEEVLGRYGPHVEERGGAVRVVFMVEDIDEGVMEAIIRLRRMGLLSSLSISRPTLEDVFLEVVGR